MWLTHLKWSPLKHNVLFSLSYFHWRHGRPCIFSTMLESSVVRQKVMPTVWCGLLPVDFTIILQGYVTATGAIIWLGTTDPITPCGTVSHFIIKSTVLYMCIVYDDVIKWEHFLRYWPFVRGIQRSPVNSPHKGRWGRAFMFYSSAPWINGRVNNQEAGWFKTPSRSLWRHCNAIYTFLHLSPHFDVCVHRHFYEQLIPYVTIDLVYIRFAFKIKDNSQELRDWFSLHCSMSWINHLPPIL